MEKIESWVYIVKWVSLIRLKRTGHFVFFSFSIFHVADGACICCCCLVFLVFFGNVCCLRIWSWLVIQQSCKSSRFWSVGLHGQRNAMCVLPRKLIFGVQKINLNSIVCVAEISFFVFFPFCFGSFTLLFVTLFLYLDYN